MVKIKNKNLIKSILVTLSLVLTFSFGLVIFKDNVNVVNADSVEVELDSQVNKVTSSSTAPTIDSSYFDYKSADFASKIDYFTTSICNFDTSFLDLVSYALNITLDSNFVYKNNNIHTMLYSLNSDGSIYSYDLVASQCTFNSGTDYSYVNVFTDVNGVNTLLKDFKLSIIVIYDSATNLYYVICTPRLSNLYSGYVDGLADADTTSAYNNGYAAGHTAGYNEGLQAGKNDVINNPSNYNLYTKQQFDNNYTTGYNSGYTAGKNFVLNNLTDFNLYTKQEYDNNYDAGYNAGVTDSDNYQTGYDAGLQAGKNDVINNPSNYNLYTKQQFDNNYDTGYTAGYEAAKNDFTGLGIFSYATYYNYAKGVGSNSNHLISSGRLNSNNVTYYNGGFYNDKTLRTELESYLNNNSDNYNGGILSLVFDSPISTTRYYNFVTRGFEFGNSIDFYFDDNTTLNYNRADNFNTDAINLQNLNKNIVKIDLNFANADYLVVGLSANTLVEDSYNTGYNDGKNSVDTTIYYNNGYNTGYNNGKNDGIEAANKYSFLSLIGSVVDAPIKAFTSLFNFDLLGFNMLNFVKALFTLSVIIVVARFVVAKM